MNAYLDDWLADWCWCIASEELAIGNVRFTTFDLGGHQQGMFLSMLLLLTDFSSSSRPIYRHHYHLPIDLPTYPPIPTSSYVQLGLGLDEPLVVLGVDQEDDAVHFGEVVLPETSGCCEDKAELDALLSMEELSKVPFVVLGNKIDHPDAVSEDELRHQLGMYQTTGKGKVPLEGIRPIEVFMCSVVMRQGYGEGIRWLSQYV